MPVINFSLRLSGNPVKIDVSPFLSDEAVVQLVMWKLTFKDPPEAMRFYDRVGTPITSLPQLPNGTNVHVYSTVVKSRRQRRD